MLWASEIAQKSEDATAADLIRKVAEQNQKGSGAKTAKKDADMSALKKRTVKPVTEEHSARHAVHSHRINEFEQDLEDLHG